LRRIEIGKDPHSSPFELARPWVVISEVTRRLFLVTEFPTPRKLGERVAVVVIANAGHALIREQPVSGACRLDEARARLRGS
jgi:hypothetical protein